MTHNIKQHEHTYFRSKLHVLGFCLVLGLAGGCSTANNLGLNLDFASSDTATTQSTQATQVSAQQTSAPIAFAPVFGPPVKVAQNLSGALKTKAQEKQITVQDKATQSAYTVRGYLSASPDNQGTKLSYIWDVTNSKGQRAHRIKGEEVFPGKKNEQDPWSAVDQRAIDQIASKTAAKLATWLPKTGDNSNLVQQASLGSSSPRGSVSARPKLNIRSGSVVAIVPPIKGAPGNGRTALAEALKKKVASKGVQVASSGSGSGKYKIQGIVNLSPQGDTKQNIKLEWKVINPLGREIGTVTQQNTIPKGSLDGQWGATADYVADAASNGIVKLIKENPAS